MSRYPPLVGLFLTSVACVGQCSSFSPNRVASSYCRKRPSPPRLVNFNSEPDHTSLDVGGRPRDNGSASVIASSRRDIILSSIIAPLTFSPAISQAIDRPDAQQYTSNNSNDIIKQSSLSPLVVPLRYVPSLQAYVVSYTVGGSKFGAIVDTGSPFLLVPSYCDESKWGCYRSSSSRSSGLNPTCERFDSNEGMVEWRDAPFDFFFDDGDTTDNGGQALFPPSMTFGVLSESLMDGPGGIFLGLVRDTNPGIRPSFLGQSSVSAFSIDLRPDARPKSLALSRSNQDWISGDSIRLVRDLQRYGDPTIHYVAEALSILVNGSPLVTSNGKKKKKKTKTYVIFDSGVSGMVICPDLFDERYSSARANREKSLWGKVDVSFATERGDTLTLSANKPLTTPFGSDRPWKKRFDGHLVVVGLAFLDGKKMSIDLDRGILWIED